MYSHLGLNAARAAAVADLHTTRHPEEVLAAFHYALTVVGHGRTARGLRDMAELWWWQPHARGRAATIRLVRDLGKP